MNKKTLLYFSAAALISAAGILVYASMKKDCRPTPQAADKPEEPAYLTRLEYSCDQYDSIYNAIIIKRETPQGPVKLTADLRSGSQKSVNSTDAVFDEVAAVMEKYQVPSWHDGKKKMEYIDGTDEEIYFRWSDGRHSHESAQAYPEGCGGFFTEVKAILEKEYRRLDKQSRCRLSTARSAPASPGRN